MADKTPFEKAIEKYTGQSIDDLKNMPIAERRKLIEKKHRSRMQFKSKFPFIGRGNVLGDKTKSRQQIESELDEALM